MKKLTNNISVIEEDVQNQLQLIYACKNIDLLSDNDLSSMDHYLQSHLKKYDLSEFRILHVYDCAEKQILESSNSEILLCESQYRPRSSKFTKFADKVYIAINEYTCSDIDNVCALGGLTVFIPQKTYNSNISRVILNKCIHFGYFGENSDLLDPFFKWLINTFPKSGYATDYGLITDIRNYSKILPKFTSTAFLQRLFLPTL